MENTFFQRECDHCGHEFKMSIRFKNQQENAAFDAELMKWITIGRHNKTPEGAQKHFCKHLCAIQWLTKDQEAAKLEALVGEGVK